MTGQPAGRGSGKGVLSPPYPLRGNEREAPLLSGVFAEEVLTAQQIEAVTCPLDRPAWWIPAKYHCALDHDLSKYPGIRCVEYWRLFWLQGGVCAVCAGPAGRWRFVCDRNHDTDTIDGLTHHRCNFPITEQVRRYILNPPGRALGIKADPRAVAKRGSENRRRTRTSKPKEQTPASAPGGNSYEDKVKAALASSTAYTHTNGGS